MENPKVNIVDCLENNWDLRFWKPSVGEHLFKKWSRPTTQQLGRLKKLLQQTTKNIRGLPYDPAIWRSRALVFLGLGFPELAAGDSYKSIILFNAAIEKRDEDGEGGKLGKDAWNQFGKAAWARGWDKTPWDIVTVENKEKFTTYSLDKERLAAYCTLLDCLLALMDCHDTIEIARQGLAKYPQNPYIVARMTDVEVLYARKYNRIPPPNISITSDAGRKIVVSYPWSYAQFRSRSYELIYQANCEMRLASRDKLEIRESTVAGKNKGCMGVFAKRDIRAEAEIFNSLGPINVSPDQMDTKICYNCFKPNKSLSFTLNCCPTLRFCSLECQYIARDTYHPALCGKDFGKLYEAALKTKYLNTANDEAPPFANLLWLRMLACCVAEKESHPLQGKVFGRLGAIYNECVRWTLVGKVIGPIQILQDLGVDVFADARWEQWVLEEMWHRLSDNYINNDDGQSFEAYIGPLYSFFNHSCSPDPMLTNAPPTSPTIFGPAKLPPIPKPVVQHPYQPKVSSPLRARPAPDTNTAPVADKGARKIFHATRNIERDEEVFVSYVFFGGKNESMGVQERWAQLGHWMGRDGCGCPRCSSENNSKERAIVVLDPNDNRGKGKAIEVFVPKAERQDVDGLAAKMATMKG